MNWKVKIVKRVKRLFTKGASKKEIEECGCPLSSNMNEPLPSCVRFGCQMKGL